MARKIADRLAALPPALLRSSTSDNGKEFAQYECLTARLGVQVYFACPYRLRERNTNKHANGWPRQFAPKGENFRNVSWPELQF